MAWDAADRAVKAAATPEERHLREWDREHARGEMYRFKDEMARGFVWCLRRAVELQEPDLRAVLAPLVAQVVGEQTDPAVGALRARVAALEKVVRNLTEAVQGSAVGAD